jgi:Concanavalin A-like lectin/glucanases superfamily
MTPATIVVIIVVIILVYMFYIHFIKRTAIITKSASLKNGSNPPINEINSGQSTQYAYGIWIFVNTWDTNTNKTVFYRTNNIKLYLDANKPNLYCDITCINSGKLSTQTIMLTDNFPVQKWVYVIISSDTMIIDCYLDGKMVNSTKLKNSPNVPALPNAAPIVLGQGWDAYVAGFENWNGPIGPQQAWDKYLSGNSNVVANFLSRYSLNFAINKDNIQQSSYTVNL